MKSTLLLVPLLTAAHASAHGFISAMSINGRYFKGNTPYQHPAYPSVIRQITDINPVKGAHAQSVNCGKGAVPAALSADANPGDTITFYWKEGPRQNWPHNTGPMLTYMASCGFVPCEKFDTTKARWFKIDQVGRKPNGEWLQADLMKGAGASVKLPPNIAPGGYVIRHEIIGLHLAEHPGGAEFYPSCAQLKIGGNGKGVPKESDLVSLPGAYNDGDKGILDRDVYNINVPYAFPGPKIALLVDDVQAAVSDSNLIPSDSQKDEPTVESPPPALMAPSAATNSTNSKYGSTKCKRTRIAKRSVHGRTLTSKSTKPTSEILHHPKLLSRIMRNIAFDNIH